MKATIKLGGGYKKVMKGLDSVFLEMPGICRQAVYDGAGPVADKLRANIESVPLDSSSYFWGKHGPGRKIYGLTESQKIGLLNSMGISGFEEKIDSIDKKVGVEGYNDTITAKYPKGQPNAMILRSIESGTEWHSKNPVVRKTANSTRKQVKEIMSKTITKSIKNKLL